MAAPARNVILFGETGGGKTAIAKTIAGTNVSPISNRVCPLYPIQIGGSEYAIHDTPGIDPTTLGTDPVTHLVGSLQDGVGLLVFCMQGRITEDAVAIYKHVRSLFKRRAVPVVVVITGLENEDSMESWWAKNRSIFTRHEMLFDDHACVTTLRGKGSMFAVQYDESTTVLRNLIAARCLKKGQRAILQRRKEAPPVRHHGTMTRGNPIKDHPEKEAFCCCLQ